MIAQRITKAVNESHYRPKDLLQEGSIQAATRCLLPSTQVSTRMGNYMTHDLHSHMHTRSIEKE